MKARSIPILILLLMMAVGLTPSRAICQTINDAAANGDVAAVERMIARAPRLANYVGPDSNSPLHWAAWNGHAEVVAVLLEDGAEINQQRTLDGWTPLFCATWNGHIDVMEMLLQHGADREIRSTDGNTALHKAAHNGQEPAAAFLIGSGQDIDEPNRDGNTPLAVAAWYGQVGVAKLLIGAGADIDHKNKAGHTALDEAMRAGQTQFADLIRNYQSALQDRTARDAARKASGITIRAGYLNWSEPNAQAKSVYSNDFTSGKVGSEWSTLPLPGDQQAPLRVSTTPIGDRRFLGEFGSQAVRLTLLHLPPHQEVSVSFDLYAIRSLDGNDANAGPDIWYLKEVDGPTLLYTTFENPGIKGFANLRIQAYPGEYPGDHYLPLTGAVELNSLGYTFPESSQNILDSVYKLSYTFSHTSSALLLDFAATGLQILSDESWGITNIQVNVAAPAPLPMHHVVAVRPAPVHPVNRAAPAATRVVRRRAAVSKPHTRTTARAAQSRRSTASVKPSSHSTRRLHPKEKPPAP